MVLIHDIKLLIARNNIVAHVLRLFYVYLTVRQEFHEEERQQLLVFRCDFLLGGHLVSVDYLSQRNVLLEKLKDAV
jgi:hypothetical protein